MGCSERKDSGYNSAASIYSDDLKVPGTRLVRLDFFSLNLAIHLLFFLHTF